MICLSHNFHESDYKDLVVIFTEPSYLEQSLCDFPLP